jgi:hypothetical protein
MKLVFCSLALSCFGWLMSEQLTKRFIVRVRRRKQSASAFDFSPPYFYQGLFAETVPAKINVLHHPECDCTYCMPRARLVLAPPQATVDGLNCLCFAGCSNCQPERCKYTNLKKSECRCGNCAPVGMSCSISGIDRAN